MEIEAQTDDGRIFLVRIIPYRTMTNVIDGVVITLADISQRKKLENQLRRANMVCENLLELVPEPYLLLDRELRVVAANRKFYETFKTEEKTLVGEKFFESGKKRQSMPELKKKLLAFAGRTKERTESFSVTDTFPGLGRKSLSCSIRRLAGGDEDGGDLILVLMEIEKSK
jgi:two-component system CheB/CheR fusion protein